jgi:hypothetical protein
MRKNPTPQASSPARGTARLEVPQRPSGGWGNYDELLNNLVRDLPQAFEPHSIPGDRVDLSTAAAGTIPATSLATANTMARAFGPSSAVSLGTSPAIVQLPNRLYDPDNLFSVSTFKYTVPATGYYEAWLNMTCFGPAGWIEAQLMQNSTAWENVVSDQSAADNLSVTPKYLFSCTTGDTLYFTAAASAAGAFSYTTTTAAYFRQVQ